MPPPSQETVLKWIDESLAQRALLTEIEVLFLLIMETRAAFGWMPGPRQATRLENIWLRVTAG